MAKNLKLVDILARELMSWPLASTYAWQDWDREVRFRNAAGYNFVAATLCDDHIREKGEPGPYFGVTRAEWQAARDALLAGDKVKAWDGEGLPPVGTVCELKFGHWNEWERCTVLCVGEKMVFVRQVTRSGEIFEGSMNRDGVMFRPIRTAEQIEAEDLERRLVQMSRSYQDATGREPSIVVREAFKALDKEGYRKQEQSK